MSPKPDDDDLFIEPAEDEDVVYGDYNSTMDGSSAGQRPYIRLTSQLKNTTRNSGTDIRFKCEAVGTPPVVFTWLKNHAPLEKSSRIKEKHRDTSSRLTISNLDVLDSGYYQCIASNAAASVNSTSVLRVNNVPDSVKSRKGNKIEHSTDYEDYELMDRGRLPDEEDADLYRVPDSAGGEGYSAINTDRWLDGIKYQKGACVPYHGEACRLYLSGRHVALTSENREDMYDIDRNIRAGIMVINSLPSISPQCRQISQEVACFHMYKVCDGSNTSKPPLTICKSDCEKIQNDVCKNEFALAAQHELVGDNQKAMFPSCPKLSITKDNCIPVIQKQSPPSTSDNSRGGAPVHWCYVNTGTTYEGAVSTTESGKICANWEESTSREYNVRNYPELRRARNNCRNPGGKKARPWCFTKGIGQEEYCDITECPKEMYPHLQDKTTNSSPTDSIISAWDGLSQSWQLALVGGAVGLFLILLLLICCCCCCKTKKNKTQKGRNTTNNQHLSAPPSIINSAGNSTYYRKLNGTSTPIMGGRPGGPMEMTSLLSGNGQIQNQLGAVHPPPYMEQYEQPQQPYHIPEIPMSQLILGDIIGEGQFGIIQTGSYIGGMISGGELQVAVKSLRIDATNADKASLEAEIRIVAEFEHDNVVKLIGVTYQPGLAAVFNYMVHGDLHDLLRLRAPNENFDRIPDMEEFMNISTQISCGMDYLSSMGFVHRDLSARNCLVADGRIIKIAPFGVMRKCYEQFYYKIPHRPWLAVRWQPREAVEGGRYSSASDVWSFGVTLWEIWSYGRQPYENATNQQVIELIANRILLDCPHNCPSNIYSLMVECWHENPDRRPTFSEISNRLQQWTMASPAHSILNPARNSNSSQSGSSNSGRPPVSKALGRSQPSTVYPPVRGRRQEDSSPLMRRENANYTYSDGESDD